MVRRSHKDVEEEFQVCHLDVLLFEYIFQRFGEGGGRVGIWRDSSQEVV